jgi:uncharacterized membrane protein
VLRVWFLGNEPLWRDEAFTAITVHRSIGSMLNIVAHDSAPPLAYLLQHFVTTVWYSDASLRLVSCLAGIVAIPIAAAIGLRVAGRRGQLWAAMAMAIMPNAVLAARDARMYSLAMTLALLSALLLWRFVEAPSLGRWLAFAVSCAAALYTDYFTAFAICGELLAAWVWFRPPRRTLFYAGAAAAVALLCLVPWLWFARAQFSHGSAEFWVGPVGITTVGGVALQFFGGPPVDAGAPLALWLWVLQGIAGIAGVAAMIALYVNRRSLDRAHSRASAYLLCSGLFAFGLLVAVSLWHPLVDARYVSAMWGPLICAVGVGASLIRSLPLRRIGFGAMLICSVVLSLALRNPNTPAVLADVGDVSTNNFIDASPSAYLLIMYYGTPSQIAHTKIVAGSVAWYWGTAAYPAGSIIPRVPANVVASHGTVYYIDAPGFGASSLPAGYRKVGPVQCASTMCVTTYRPS